MKCIKIIITIILLINIFTLVGFADYKDTLVKVDTIGYIILEIVWKIAYWGIAVKGVYTLFTTVKEKDKKGIAETITYYGALWAAVRFFPEILKMITNMLG